MDPTQSQLIAQALMKSSGQVPVSQLTQAQLNPQYQQMLQNQMQGMGQVPVSQLTQQANAPLNMDALMNQMGQQPPKSTFQPSPGSLFMPMQANYGALPTPY